MERSVNAEMLSFFGTYSFIQAVILPVSSEYTSSTNLEEICEEGNQLAPSTGIAKNTKRQMVPS